MRLRCGVSLRVQTLLVLLAAALPAAAYGGYEAVRERERLQARALTELTTVVQTAGDALRNGIDRDRHVLRLVAEIDAVRSFDAGRCPQILADVLRRFPDYRMFSVFDENRHVRCSAATSERQGDDRPPTATLSVPILHGGDEIVGTLTSEPFLPGYDALVAAIRAMELEAALIGPDAAPRRLLGGTAPAVSFMPAMLPESDAGWIAGQGHDGVARFYTVLDLAPADLRLIAATREAALRATADRRLADAILVPATLAAAVLLLAWCGIDYVLSRWVRVLSHSLLAVSWSGIAEQPPTPRLRSTLSMLSTAIAFAGHRIRLKEAEGRRAANRSETLLRETGRRTAAGLRLVSYLIGASRRSDTILTDARSRLQVLELVHDLAAIADDPATVDLRILLQQICRRLLDDGAAGGPGRAILYTVESPNLPVETGKAAMLALFVAEAVMNARQHAFPDGRNGRVTVGFAADPEQACMSIVDDGVGLGNQVAPNELTGFRMMDALARQLGGQFRIHSDAGTIVSLLLTPDRLTRP